MRIIAFRKAGSLVVVGISTLMAIPGSTVQASPRMHSREILALESKSQLSPQELLSLGKHHRYMGDMYGVLARSCAYLTLEAVDCYQVDPAFAWAADYFGALAALALDDREMAGTYLRPGSNERPVLSGLRNILRSYQKISSRNASSIVWKDFAPATLWDSLEVASRLSGERNYAGNVKWKKPSTTVVDGIQCSPLLDRARLAAMLMHNDLSELRIQLRAYVRDGFPLWTMSTERGRATFGDPQLLTLAATGHLRLASENFAEVMAKSHEEKLIRQTRYHWLHTCLVLGQAARADSLLGAAESEPLLLPYRGWVAWAGGKTAEAQQIWDKCRTGQNVKVKTNLLVIWSLLPDHLDDADRLRRELLDGLGNARQQSRLRKNREGRNRLISIHRRIGEWYFRRGILDSASHHMGESHVLNSSVSLDNYSANYCALYFSAKALDGAPDFRQEGFAGFTYLRRYFPAVQIPLEPLSTAIQCYTRSHLELRANESQN